MTKIIRQQKYKNIPILEKLHTELKVKAAREQTSLIKLVEKILKDYFEREPY